MWVQAEMQAQVDLTDSVNVFFVCKSSNTFSHDLYVFLN